MKALAPLAAPLDRTMVIRCIWGKPDDSYVMRPDLQGEAMWDREHAHRFTPEEATAWIAAQWRDRFLLPEDYVMKIDATTTRVDLRAESA